MDHFIIFLHILSAIGMGFYFMLPFLTFRFGKDGHSTPVVFAQSLVTGNRIGQVLLIVQLLTGGYLIGKLKDTYHFTVAWMIVVIVLLLLIGALSGMFGSVLRRIVKNLQVNQPEPTSDAAKAKRFSCLIALFMLFIIIMMVYPNIF